MNKVIHHNYWYWGESYIISLNDGHAIVNLQIADNDKERGCISGLSVQEDYRKMGLGNKLLLEVQSLAKQLNLKEIYLTAEKDSFTFEWYKKNGFVRDNYRHKYLYRLRKRV